MNAATETKIQTLAAEGLSLRQIAKRVGLSHVSVGKLLKRQPKAAALETNLRNRAVPEIADTPPDDAPAIVQARFLMREAREQLRVANQVGDAQLAQRQTRNAAFLANVLARLEKVEQDGADVFKISRAEIDATADTLRERLKTMRDRPLCCAECSRRLSVELAYEGREKPDVIVQFLEADEQ